LNDPEKPITKKPYYKVRLLLYAENHAIVAWFGQGLADKEEIKTPL